MNEAIPRNGPEFEPLFRFIKDFKVKVTVFDDKDKVIREEVMNYGNPSDRIWLGKLSFYYWNKGFYVETQAVKE